jgi:hypothetical protein
MKKIIALLLIAVIGTSCMTPKRMAKLCAKCPTKDSIREVVRDSIVIRDSIVVVPPVIVKDTASIRALLECDSLGNVIIKNLESKLNAAVRPVFYQKGNEIVFKCVLNTQDSLRIHLRWAERHTVKDKFVQKEKPPVVVNELKRWQVGLMWTGGISLFLLFLWVFFRVVKFVKPV